MHGAAAAIQELSEWFFNAPASDQLQRAKDAAVQKFCSNWHSNGLQGSLRYWSMQETGHRDTSPCQTFLCYVCSRSEALGFAALDPNQDSAHVACVKP